MKVYRLAEPWAMLLFILPALCIVVIIIQRLIYKKGVKISGVGSFEKGLSMMPLGYFFTIGLQLAGMFIIVFSLARPQFGVKREKHISHGIDIMITLDISESMLIPDFFDRTRLDYAKEIIDEFIAKRSGDRIGLVTFATTSLLRCPATINYDLVRKILAGITIKQTGSSSTAIGIGLASGINRLISIKDNQQTEAKILILVTDGKNNAGEITPVAAAQIAKQSGIKIYTIGIGKEEHIDMDLLKLIARETGGNFYYSERASELNKVFDEIHELEKTDLEIVEITRFKNTGYRYAVIGLVVMLIGLLLNTLFFKRLG